VAKEGGVKIMSLDGLTFCTDPFSAPEAI